MLLHTLHCFVEEVGGGGLSTVPLGGSKSHFTLPLEWRIYATESFFLSLNFSTSISKSIELAHEVLLCLLIKHFMYITTLNLSFVSFFVIFRKWLLFTDKEIWVICLSFILHVKTELFLGYMLSYRWLHVHVQVFYYYCVNMYRKYFLSCLDNKKCFLVFGFFLKN